MKVYLFYTGYDGTEGRLQNIYLDKQKAIDDVPRFMELEDNRIYVGFDQFSKRTMWVRIDEMHTR